MLNEQIKEMMDEQKKRDEDINQKLIEEMTKIQQEHFEKRQWE